MLAQRGTSKTPEVAVSRARATSIGSAPARPQSRKLSFKDKHALETLPGRIASLEQEITRLNAVLADPDLYGRQPAAFTEATKTLEAAQVSLAAAEEQWLA